MVLPASALLFIAFLGSPGPPGGCPVEPSRYAVLAPGDVVTWREGLSASEYPLATADIENAECLLLRQVDTWNSELALDGGDHIEPADYYRQYCVLRDKEGHRIEYLNAFLRHQRLTFAGVTSGWRTRTAAPATSRPSSTLPPAACSNSTSTAKREPIR